MKKYFDRIRYRKKQIKKNSFALWYIMPQYFWILHCINHDVSRKISVFCETGLNWSYNVRLGDIILCYEKATDKLIVPYTCCDLLKLHTVVRFIPASRTMKWSRSSWQTQSQHLLNHSLLSCTNMSGFNWV